MQLPSRIPTPSIKLNMKIGRNSGADIVGLDIQPGFIAAVKAKVNGSILVEHAAATALPADVVRDGEVMDQEVLSDALRELFGESKLNKRVRVGVANQRTVLRTLELPPVSDPKELSAAVTFQAQDQVPMPLSNAVLDFHPLGVVDTPAGPRQRVVLVAAQRDMVERLLAAVRRAGLTPEGVDLSAFALIRSLYRADPEQSARVLYLNVDGLTNLAIAEGKICHFTRVVGSGLEGMAGELAERRGIALTEARELLAGADLTVHAPTPMPVVQEPVEVPAEPRDEHEGEAGEPGEEHVEALEDGGEQDYQSFAAEPQASSDSEVATVLESGIREISGEVRNSLDFHRSQDGGGDVSHVVLSGSAQDIPGFAEALQSSLGLEVRGETIGLCDEHAADHVSAHRLAVATGLATSEAPQ
jgi:type IV pilus assembly protein PilM